FDQGWLAKVPGWVRSMSAASGIADDVRQRLAERMLADNDGDSALAGYKGRGSLAGWLRVAAIREARTMLRSRREVVDADDTLVHAPGHDAELALLKRRSADLFRQMFDEVVASLPDEEKSVLKLHYLDGLTLVEVASVLRMSRASV